MFAAGRQAEFPSDGNSCTKGVSLWSTQVEVRVSIEFSFSRQHFWNIKMTCVCCLFKEEEKKTERGVFPFRFSFSYRRFAGRIQFFNLVIQIMPCLFQGNQIPRIYFSYFSIFGNHPERKVFSG
jgi:hypothetical protein